MRDKACVHGNRPATTCSACARERERLAGKAQAIADGAAGSAKEIGHAKGFAVNAKDAKPLATEWNPVAFRAEGEPVETYNQSQLAASNVDAVPPGSTPQGGVMGPKAEPPHPSPSPEHPPGPLTGRISTAAIMRAAEEAVAKSLEKGVVEVSSRMGPIGFFDPANAGLNSVALGDGSHPADGAVEVEGMEPPSQVPRPGTKLSGGKVAEQAWGRDLPVGKRASPEYRLAMYRVGDDYQLVEMVMDPAATVNGGWRERLVGEPDGFDVVEARLLDRAVEWMTP